MKFNVKLILLGILASLTVFFSLSSRASVDIDEDIEVDTVSYSGNLLVVGSYISSNNPTTASLELYFIAGNTYDAGFIRVCYKKSGTIANLEDDCKERDISWNGSSYRLGWVEQSPPESFVYTFDGLKPGQKYEFVAVIFSRGVNTGIAVSDVSVRTPESTLLFL